MPTQIIQDTSLNDVSGPSVGQLLKEAREKRKITLESVAKNLCITKSQLTSIENDHENLICDVYSLGFLRSYAQFLGLNANVLVQRFKEQTKSPSESYLVFPTPIPERGIPNFQIVCLSLLGLVSVIVGYEWLKVRNPLSITAQQEDTAIAGTSLQETPPLQEPVKVAESLSSQSQVLSPPEDPSLSKTPPPEAQPLSKTSPLPEVQPAPEPQPLSKTTPPLEVKPVPEERPVQEAQPISEVPPPPEAQPLSKAIPVPEAQPLAEVPHLSRVSEKEILPRSAASSSPAPSSTKGVLLKATEDTWIEVKDDQENIVVSRVFYPGDIYEFKDFQNLTLKTGNARGVRLMAGGKTLTFPGNQGEVKGGISLNPEKWVDPSSVEF